MYGIKAFDLTQFYHQFSTAQLGSHSLHRVCLSLKGKHIRTYVRTYVCMYTCTYTCLKGHL